MKVNIDNEVKEYQSIWMDEERVICAIDQRKLPFSFEIFKSKTIDDVCFAIKDMVVRGAPLIGVTAAYGLLQTAYNSQGNKQQIFVKEISEAIIKLSQTRPTAVDLFNVLARIKTIVEKEQTIDEYLKHIEMEVQRVVQETLTECQAIGEIGNELITKESKLMTICNAGALATIDIGTALAPMRKANAEGKKITVFVCETRPRLQGGRLTAWELMNEKINHFIVTDNMIGYLCSKKSVDLAIVGADRIALNGDFANKIGTYTLSVLCKEHQIPFYVAAPTSTFDRNLLSGEAIQIEQRDSLEVSSLMSVTSDDDKKPERRFIHNFKSPNINPAFDITPNKNLTGIITPKGILSAPFNETIRDFLKK